ncbi:MAG: hypothetical protein ACYDAN_16930 [Candidatus Limnocylindrales bacterium]
MTPTRQRTLIATGLACVALVGASAGPRASLRLMTEPAGDDPTTTLVGALGLTAWAIALWLLLAAAMTAGGHLPGRTGRAAAGASRRIAPAAVRRTVELALGLTVTAVLSAGPAAASAPSLDWGTQAEASVPALDWGSAPTPAVPAVPEPAPEPTSVVVAPGDSLWSLAERDLAQHAATPPSDAAVAQAWPAWWAANREAVGPDPHLLHPGTSLTPPARP